ncbi:DUF1501 domain-containing protein [Phreatobacter oligotrophus]|jgi:uncharacterized protein (DUF1501 family)|uniref:DUF1501 domain-containing protein n=1 Tax=Phreatobacter oligotrophus TaxID=1122261 RepID=UPI0023552D5D|nr:DUF1501 domain-containing protein [Phreatobacter oligotrophus]MBX9992320.1 DUF1501 domain-containing protein [Phreatobacter oligotrophus]
MLCEDAIHPSRRAILGAAGALFAGSFAPRYAFAAGGRDPRLVVVVLRGALDGLAAVPPVGDPGYVPLRPGLALPASGDGAALLLDGFFGLLPAMPNLARLYQAKQAAIVHATATGYRERSHFDGQDVLESGQPRPGLTQSGWLNRAIALLPPGERIGAKGALGIGAIAPLVVRGQAPVLGWAPQGLQQADDDVARRVLQLYDEREPRLAAALRQGLDTSRMASASGLGGLRPRSSPADPEGMALIATGAAKLMAAPDGPRVAALALEGWDTHVNAGGATGQLATRLGGLDRVFAIFEEELKAVWRETVVVVMTEFGRTARVNGTTGTDHGTATVAFLAGGAVKGGRVVADWPGLAPNKLFEGRDLAATTDLRAVLKGVLVDHLGMDAKPLAETIFPGTLALPPMRGLIG